MVYRVGNWPVTGSLWDRLEIPYFDDPAIQLEIKALTMLCNLYLARGEDMMVLGDTARASRDFSTAGELVSQTMEASLHNSLGVFFRHKRRPDLADKEYQLALESRHLTGNEKSNVLVNLGNLRKDLGKFDEAVDNYNRALAINAENKDARYNLALVNAYMALSKNDNLTAIRAFEEALSISTSDPRLIYNVAVLYDRSLGDTASAIYNYELFARFAPGMAESREALERIRQLRGLQ
jgi:tetratricopeptide (TPR) repeat protein